MKIKFIYSYPYDLNLSKEKDILPYKDIVRKRQLMEFFWKKNGKKVESSIKNILGLDFIESEITCYLNSSKSFSDPLTVKMYKDDMEMIDTLIHELIHVVMIQNEGNKTFMRKWKWFYEETFSHEKPVVRTHIAVHAIHALICKKVMPERLVFVEFGSKDKDYLKSWRIAQQIGYDHVAKLIAVKKK